MNHKRIAIEFGDLRKVFFALGVRPVQIETAAEQLMRARKQRYRPPVFRHSDPLWGVNGTTLSGFHRLITRIPFREVKCRHSPLVSPFRSKWERWHMKYYALPFKLVANLPLLWEIFTDRVILEATR